MSKYVYFVPCKSTISVEELAQLFIAMVMSQHGMPKRIISDHDGRYLKPVLVVTDECAWV